MADNPLFVHSLFLVRVSHYVKEEASIVLRARSAEHARAAHEKIYAAVCEDPGCWDVVEGAPFADGDVDVSDWADPQVMRFLPVFNLDDSTGDVRRDADHQRHLLQNTVRTVLERNHGRSLDDAEDRDAVLDDLLAALTDVTTHG